VHLVGSYYKKCTFKTCYTICFPQNVIDFIILSFSVQIIHFSQTTCLNVNTHPSKMKFKKGSSSIINCVIRWQFTKTSWEVSTESNTSGIFTLLLSLGFKVVNNFKHNTQWKYSKCAFPHSTPFTLRFLFILAADLPVITITIL